jgi:hypothetical protein
MLFLGDIRYLLVRETTVYWLKVSLNKDFGGRLQIMQNKRKLIFIGLKTN